MAVTSGVLSPQRGDDRDHVFRHLTDCDHCRKGYLEGSYRRFLWIDDRLYRHRRRLRDTARHVWISGTLRQGAVDPGPGRFVCHLGSFRRYRKTIDCHRARKSRHARARMGSNFRGRAHRGLEMVAHYLEQPDRIGHRCGAGSRSGNCLLCRLPAIENLLENAGAVRHGSCRRFNCTGIRQ